MKLRKDKWQSISLNDICDISVGSTPLRTKKEFWTNGTIPWFTIDDIRENGRAIYDTKQKITELAFNKSSVKYLPANSILLCCTASVGEYAIAKIPLTTNQQFIGLVIKDENIILSDFLFHFSSTLKSKLLKLSGKTTIDFVPIYRVKDLPIPLPPLEEQKQIAALFQSIDTAIEQVAGQEKNLKALQKSLADGLLKPEPEFGNLVNKTNCTSTTFGEIAECDKKYPEHEKEVDRFVGLEWIEADNFQLQGYGLVANGTTFTKRFAKGDVLFGKRRAYLKKVAIADFDGICSGDILVIRANAKKMMQELLPFYISADAFINHAVSTSAGSLSPRTKWKDLAELEVSIPDLKTQEKILNIFSQLQSALKLLKQQKTTLQHLKQKLLSEILG